MHKPESTCPSGRLIQALPTSSTWERAVLETASNGFWHLGWEIKDVTDRGTALSTWGASLGLLQREGEWIREIDDSRPGTSGLLAGLSSRAGTSTLSPERATCTRFQPCANASVALPPTSVERTTRQKEEDDALLEEMMGEPSASPSAVPAAGPKR